MSYERTDAMDICILFEEDFIECIERGRMYLTIGCDLELSFKVD
jgi:hypothetical protein